MNTTHCIQSRVFNNNTLIGMLNYVMVQSMKRSMLFDMLIADTTFHLVLSQARNKIFFLLFLGRSAKLL